MDKNLPRKIRRRPVNLFRRAAALFLLFSSCEPTLVAEFQDVPVVEGYLYSGEPASVRISKLIPYRSDVTFSDEDVDSLRVEIADETDGATYALRSQGGGLYVDSTLLPKAGHSYRLTFAYNGVQVDALTELAAAPESVTVSPTSITVASWGEGGGGFGGGGGGFGSMPDPVSIAWSNPNRDYYLVVVDNTDANPVSVRDSASTASLSFLTGLTQDSIVQLSSQMFSYTGRHVVKLCRVQPEYTVMVQANSSSRSESLTEVHANVTNGFGIFTGMSAHSAVITVHK